MSLTEKAKVEEAVEWYKQKYDTYAALSQTVESLVRNILNQEHVNFHEITNRPKSIERYREKASKEKYKDPRSEIMDMAGIRIITYIDSDAKRVEEIIKKNFELRLEHSKDKSEDLGIDRFGYNSIHCVCTLGKSRSALSEYQKFAGLRFEIQIRTILQHAWAEFEHDKNYKFKGVLPSDIRRRLAMVAGNLELLDWTFESISKDIDDYIRNLERQYKSGDLSSLITSASLKVYLAQKFSKVGENLKPNRDEDDDIKMVTELEKVGIRTLEALHKSIPNDFVEMVTKCKLSTTYLGLLRYIMIIHNAEKYFENAWNYSWNYLDKEAVTLLDHYNIPETRLMNYLRKRKTSITL